MSLPQEEFEPEVPSGELVHWMTPDEMRFGPAGLAAAFGLGLALGLGALAAFQWLAPRRPALSGQVPAIRRAHSATFGPARPGSSCSRRVETSLSP